MNKGDKVVIVRGQRSRGEEGTIVWIGQNRFDEGLRVGIKIEGVADPVFVNEECADVLEAAVSVAKKEERPGPEEKKAAQKTTKTSAQKTTKKRKRRLRSRKPDPVASLPVEEPDEPRPPRVDPPKREPELERLILEDPDDRTRYAVYADWLQDTGDPRGELIATQISAEEHEAHKEAADELLAEYEQRMRWRVPVLNEKESDGLLPTKPFTWRWGFVDQMAVSNVHVPHLDALFDEPELLVMRELEFRSTTCEDLTPVTKLRALRKVDVTHNLVTDLTPLASLVELRALRCWGETLREVPDLSPLTNLKTLDLCSTRVNDLSRLGVLENLTELLLAETNLRDVTTFPELPRLKGLSLRKTIVKDLSGLASKAPNLEVIALGNTLVSDVSQFTAMSSLKSLGLNATRVTDISPLQEMTNLEVINLALTEVSDISMLARLPRLQTLYTARAPIPPEQLQALQEALPALDIDNTYTWR
jgi:uncharacterized protein (TIGR02996 family)